MTNLFWGQALSMNVSKLMVRIAGTASNFAGKSGTRRNSRPFFIPLNHGAAPQDQPLRGSQDLP
ncbi:MAG: hypothetical protein CMN05_12340 [Roseibacillus sp.]|nr:hypothetical protein [Roseibacillus sp.]MBP36135.1 hypothetical protein [Roseibacillus sp.]